jgi:hypothetical protein
LFLGPALVSSAYLFCVSLVLFVCLWLGSAPAGHRLDGSSFSWGTGWLSL